MLRYKVIGSKKYAGTKTHLTAQAKTTYVVLKAADNCRNVK